MLVQSELYATTDYDEAARQMLAVLIGASSPSQNGKSARCWTFASDELATKTNATYGSSAYYSKGRIIAGTVTPSGNGSGTSPSNAFDENASTRWQSSALPGWIQIQFPSARVIRTYALSSRSDYVGYAPSSWVLQGSNDGSTWSNLDTRSGVPAWALSEERSYDVTTPGAYAYYRLYGMASALGSVFEVAEIKLYAVSNITLIPSAVTVASAPTRMDVYFLIQPIDAIAPSIDVIAYASRDGGSSYSAGTLKLFGAYDATYNLYQATFRSSALPASGTSVLWKLLSANTKQIAVRGAVMFWEL